MCQVLKIMHRINKLPTVLSKMNIDFRNARRHHVKGNMYAII